jgi:hypothetical protein
VPAKETSFADTRFPWRSVTDGLVTVNYYDDRQRDAEIMALVARETIDKAAALMGASFDFPIRIWVYANRRDFQIAVAHESVSSDPGVLGQAHEPDTFILVVDRLSSPSALDTARHELTHLVTARALSRGANRSAYPSWLNEGTSVYFQVSPNDVGYVEALEKAIKEDKVIPLKLLTSGTRNRNVGLFYGEGYSVVKFLVDSYGAEKFAQMIAAFNRTGQIDEAFKETYGADQTGIYERWRESVGLSAAGPAPSEPPAAPAAAPTPQPADLPHAVPADLQAYLDQQEREILVKALRESGFNRTAAAQRLGLSLRQIRYRIARLAIAAPGGDEPNDDPS